LLPAENNIIQSIELSQAGKGDASKSGFFLNIHLKHEFIESQVMNLLKSPHVELEHEHVA
jgi:hypothetical protein